MVKTILIKVHRVLDGPYEDEDGNYWLNCRVEDPQERNPSKVMFDEEIPFVSFDAASFDAAYEFQKHFYRSIEPILIEFEMDTRYDS
jgi:hypothetical protein